MDNDRPPRWVVPLGVVMLLVSVLPCGMVFIGASAMAFDNTHQHTSSNGTVMSISLLCCFVTGVGGIGLIVTGRSK